MEDNIQLGHPAFNKMMFVLKKPITQKNHKDYRFMNEEMQEISNDIWAMPAYMKAEESYSLFFIFTKIESGDTVVAFSEGQFNKGEFRLNDPMISGEALNHLKGHNEKRAISVLHFLNQISKANEGNWRMVED